MPNEERQPSVIAQLRKVMPARPVTLPEAVRIAELQATRLLSLLEVEEPPVPSSVVLDLPHIEVEWVDPLPMSGYTHWSKGRWQIVLNGAEPGVRQRFSLMHEFKHVLDHPFITEVYRKMDNPEEWAEQVCHYFAGCVLMPRSWVKSQYFNRSRQDVASLASHFDVSRSAMRVRLTQIGVAQIMPRCGYYSPSRRPTTEIAA